MNSFSKILLKHDLYNSDFLSRAELTTLQVNVGNLCNQNCVHCHVDASPSGKNIMTKKVMDDILGFLSRYKIKTLDITGGAPELNPNFEYFLKEANDLVNETIVRTNLTVLMEKGKEHLPKVYKELNVHLICSLPCYLEKNVDAQRGGNVFSKSVDVLKKLNNLGYAKNDGMLLDLVYNPMGSNLPPSQAVLEKEYKEVLANDYGIEFDRLITITNVPIKRFKKFLESNGEYDKYCDLLENNFNPDVVKGIMCRTFISVGYDGKLYDCDFNQALGMVLKDKNNDVLTIDKLRLESLIGSDILIGEHCLSCTAGGGSSCQGALASEEEVTKGIVKKYYGETLKTKDDLKTNACCSSETMPKERKDILRLIEPEILDKFYGCGSPIPPCLDGCTVLDLGCGTGRDVYIASYLAGEKGKVIGVDMTDEQLSVAEKYKGIQAEKFGYKTSNVEFRKSYIEDLASVGIKDNSVDVVISNCVVNLSTDKKSVVREVFRVLKEGGELYFSDVFADRRVPEQIKNDPVFYGECLGGALYIEDFRRMLRDAGCLDHRIVKSRKLSLDNEEMREKAKGIGFYSMTIRAFKLSTLEDICEDYGQVAVYNGTIKDHPNEFILDDNHVFVSSKPVLVCGNTATMLSDTRYSSHFQVIGDRDIHFGSFKCVPVKADNGSSMLQGGSCC